MTTYKVISYDPKHSEDFEVEEDTAQSAADVACAVMYDRSTIAVPVRDGLFLPVAIATGATYGMLHLAEVEEIKS